MYFMNQSSDYFPFKTWIPALPDLRLLKVERGCTCDSEKEFILKLIDAAPNLKKLKGAFNSDCLKDFPKAACALLDHFCLSVGSAEQERNCLKLAEAAPALSKLQVSYSPSDSQRRFTGSFLCVLEKLYWRQVCSRSHQFCSRSHQVCSRSQKRQVCSRSQSVKFAATATC